MNIKLAAFACIWCWSFLPSNVSAQITKCISPGGKVEYRHGLCEGAAKHGRMTGGTVSTVDAMPDHEIDRTLRPPVSRSPETTYSTAKRAGRVPSEIDIKNMETSANSISLSERERLMRRAEIAAARDLRAGGSGQLDTSALDAYDQRSAARRAAAQRSANNPTHMTSCDRGGCWDNTGSRYNKAAGGNMFRQDGKFCTRVGSNYQCN